jgi:acyl carrier protein
MKQTDLINLFKSVFPTADLNIPFTNLEINSIPEWDSLGNLNLLLRIEEHLNIRLSSEELSEIKSIKELIKILKIRGLYED